MKTFRFLNTINGRMLTLAIGIEVVMLTLLVLNSMRLLHGAMTDQAYKTAKQYHPVLEAALTAPMAQRDYATVQSVLDESRSRGGVDYIVVVDRSGHRIGSSGWDVARPLPAPSSGFLLFDTAQKLRYDVVTPIELYNQKLGVLHFGLDLSQIASARKRLLLQGFGIAAVELVFSSLVMLLIGYWLTRKLTALTKASLQVTAGNLTPPPVSEGNDDIGQLGVAFNTMSRAIAQRVGELTVAKEVAEQSEIKLSNITNSANDAILMMNPQGAITYWNPAAERIFGYSVKEALGKDLHELLVPYRYHARHRAAFPEFLCSGQGLAVGKTLDLFALRKDGSEVAVSVSLSAVLLQGAWHAVGIVHDITERKQMESNLRKLSSAVEHSPVAIVITDRDGQIEYVNPKFCQMTGYNTSEVAGVHVSILRSPNHSQEFYDNLWATIQSGHEWHGEFQNRRKDGSLVWTMSSFSPLFDKNGEITHFVGVREDIENQKRLQAELANIAQLEKVARDKAEQANRAKSEFLASMSHEIRTPLNAIIGMSDILSESTLTLEQTDSLLVIQNAGQSLYTLIDNILDLSKIEAGMLQLDPHTFVMKETLQQLLQMMSVKSFAKGVQLTSQVSQATPVWLLGDSHRLSQILLNLIGNAIKFTEQGGTVSVKVETLLVTVTEAQLRFSVKDTGIGIPQDKLQTIFADFTQADTSTTRSYGGSGLGLAISRRLANLMGGEISVESTPGQGSCFYLTLCFAISDAPPLMNKAEDALEEGQSRSLSILVVDDNKDNRVVLSKYFQKTDHRIDMAENGMEALEKIKDGGYDLVLMDMEMPVMDGYTAVRLVREWEFESGRQQLPIIALTANALKEDKEKSFAVGCSAHMTKPIKKVKLLEAVTHYGMLGGRQ